ncbi:biotin--[acetyl-CoA-carboxylase] ligase [Halomarina halobia]|uniref:Biotin--[acetyl-CoA-carboxylase] ligase n=1 Tax=Halomarina halobia TaxID=3033386 RepID=A0ABD6A495_9EURY|nr:biotin--[acetyl-CoA-carboxylase] ligase [Halomarina sp. PSR21]
MNETRRRVLDALADGPVSGPALADDLGVSRTAVWKHVEALREAGFGVESVDDGYRLTAVPESGAAALEFGLDAPFSVEHHASLDSTNRRARELAEGGANDVAVVADAQTGGRGRLDREWTSPPGGVYLSVVCRPELPMARAPLFTLAAAVAATRAAREAGVDARIKWPNDVLVPDDEGGTRKLAGVLTEARGETDRVEWLVVGVGVNVEATREELPAGATSLRAEGVDPDRRAFVQRLLETFHDLRRDLDAVLPAWRELALTLGQRVRVETPGGEVVGRAVDVESPGTLVVETDDGPVRVTAGDCEHLRPLDTS